MFIFISGTLFFSPGALGFDLEAGGQAARPPPRQEDGLPHRHQVHEEHCQRK